MLLALLVAAVLAAPARRRREGAARVRDRDARPGPCRRARSRPRRSPRGASARPAAPRAGAERARGPDRPLVAGDGRPADVRDQRGPAADRQGRVLGRTAADRRAGREPLGVLALGPGDRRAVAPRRAADRPRRRRRAGDPGAAVLLRPVAARRRPAVRGRREPRLPGRPRRDHAGLARARPRVHVRSLEPHWREQPRPRHGRWYPSQVQLPDGRIAILAGFDEHGQGGKNIEMEVFTPAAQRGGVGTHELPPGRQSRTAFYPHLFTLPGGKVLLAGPDASDSAELDLALLNNTTPESAWDDADLSSLNHSRVGGNAVRHPTGAVTLFGGWDYVAQGGDAVADTETLVGKQWTLNGGGIPRMNLGRSYGNVVQLPNGELVAIGGGAGYRATDASNWTDDDQRLKQVELLRPASTRSGGSARRSRSGGRTTRRRCCCRTAACSPPATTTGTSATSASRRRQPDGRGGDLLAAVPVRRRPARGAPGDRRTRRPRSRTASGSASPPPARRARCSSPPARRPTAPT